MSLCLYYRKVSFTVARVALGVWLSSFVMAVASPQPVLYYDFERHSGATVENLGSLGGSGTLINSPGWVTGTPGAADGGIEFNGLTGSGSASYIDTGFSASALGLHSSSGVKPYTMSAWLKAEPAEWNAVFGQIAAGSFLHHSLKDNRPHFGHYGDDVVGAYDLNTGTWHHVVWQFDENRVKRLFVDGIISSVGVSELNCIRLDNTVVIGTAGDYHMTFGGVVDDVAIYTNVLAANHIYYLAQGGSPTDLPADTAVEGLCFTARTGSDNTWNLYQVVGGELGSSITWWQAYQKSTNMLYEGVRGHLATVHSIAENEFCRFLGNLYRADLWIGLTDNDTNTWNTVLFPGAYESGNTTDVPDVNTRRNNGWVWVNGEDYGAATYQNWAYNEPNDLPSEDAVILRRDGYWNDYGSGIPGSGDPENTSLAIIEWDMNSPDPIEGAFLRAPVLPPPEELPGGEGSYGSFAGVWARDAGVVANTYQAAEILASGAGTVTAVKTGIPVINAYDPDETASKNSTLFWNNKPFFADQPGVLESNYVAFYRGMIEIPEAGEYTFGVHSGGGFALRLPGFEWDSVSGAGWIDHGDSETMTYVYDTDDSNTRGVLALPKGVRSIEFLTWNDHDGRRYHELYAAKGAFKNDSETGAWRLIGHKSVGELSYVGVSSEGWTTWHSENEAVGSLEASWNAVSNYVAVGSNQNNYAEINFWDPQSGQHGLVPDSAPFPWNTEEDDNNKALFGRATLSVPADRTLLLGFQGDDGSRLTVSNQTFNTPLVYAVNSNSMVVGESLEHNVGTSNSRTIGSIDLLTGEYPISFLFWEGTGGSYLDVFQINENVLNGALPFSYPPRALSADSAELLETDVDGLRLIGNDHFYLILR